MLDKYFPYYILTFFVSLLLTAIIEKNLIPYLKRRAEQPIYEGGPSWHSKKSGTPTMGGIAFVLAISASILPGIFILFFAGQKYAALSLILSLVFSLGNAAVGLIDDAQKLKKHENAGLSPKQKLVFQFVLAALFVLASKLLLGKGTEISFSFGKIDVGPIYYPLLVIFLVGMINSANLTDGIDGLASSVAFSVGISLFYISASLMPELSFLSASLVGATIGFLLFNLNPAKVFMGDTGSLFLGGIIASSSLILENPLIVFFIAGVYVIEGFSVALQVAVYKLTKKRVFKMAPLHHHLEKSGYSENKICIIAIFLTFLFSVPAYIFYLP